jgi:small subunit ribosomal protein S6
MANKLYETLFLLDPTKVSADADGVKNQIHAILERHGAHIEVSRPWDYNHKLSYPIGKQKKGSYHIVYYTMESTRQAEIERDFALHPDVVLRYMTTRVEPKWQEEVMKVAREDAGAAFALRGMQDEAAVQTDPAAIGGEGAPAPAGGEGADGGAPAHREGGPGGRRRREMAEKPE